MTNAAEAWQRGYESVRFLARYSLYHCWVAWLQLSMGGVTMQVDLDPLVANFTSRVGTCVEIVGPFEYLLHVTAHPHFLVLELQAPKMKC